MKNLISILKYFIPVVFLYFIFRKVEFDDIYAAFKQADLFYIFLGLVLLIPNIWIQGAKWLILIRIEKPEATFWESVKSILIGFPVGLLTPGRSGDLVRALALDVPEKLKMLGWAVLDKAYSQAPVIIFGLFGFLYYLAKYTETVYYVIIPLGIMFVIISVLITAFALMPQALRSVCYAVSVVLPYRDRVKSAINHLDQLKQKKAGKLYIYSILFYFIYIVQFLLLARAFDTVPLIKGMAAAICMNLTKSLLPFSLGDLGIREGASIYFFTNMGMSEITALNASLLLFSINVLLPSLLGLVFFPALKIKILNKK